MISKLVLKNFQHEKIRILVAVLGVAAAVGMVVWSLGLSFTAAAQSRASVQRMTAPFNAWITSGTVGVVFNFRVPANVSPERRAPITPVINAQVADSIAKIKGVTNVHGYKTIRTTLDFRPGGRILQGPPIGGALVLADQKGCPYQNATISGTWPDPDSSEPLVAVSTAVFTPRRLEPPPIGSPLVLMTPAGAVTAKISAIIDYPQGVYGFPLIFATQGTMKLASPNGEFDPAPNLILYHAKDAATLTAVEELTKNEDISAVSSQQVESQFASDKLKNFKRQAPLLLTLSVLTAICMLINTLTVGIDHKLRILALLRTAGMTVRQMVQSVALEGTMIGAGGWLTGVLGGWVLLYFFVKRAPETFPEGVAMGWITPAAVAGGVALVTAISLFLPCRRIARVRPLDVLSSQPDLSAVRSRFRTSLPWLGFVMLFPMLVLALPLSISPMTRSVLLLTVGIPLHIAGLILFLPHFIRGVERVGAPLVSSVLRLNRVLLHQRISQHASRTIGMVLTLTVGLGTYAAIHIWGGSMMQPFVPSRTFPDVIVSFLPHGIERQQINQIKPLPGVADQRVLPLVASQFYVADQLTENIIKKNGAGKKPSSDNILLCGTDPQAAFGGDNPLATFRFVAGNRQTAAEALTQGGACIIHSMFARESGLGVGDTLQIKERSASERRRGRGGEGRGGRGGPPPPPDAPLKDLRIVGVVDLNWHLVTSRAMMRGREGMPVNTFGPVFVSEDEVRNLNHNHERTPFLWLNLSKEYRKINALTAGQQLDKNIKAAIQVDENITVRVHHRDEIEDGTLARGSQLIGDMTRAPFWSLIVLSTGIITLMISSFYSSARTFAVMRAVGMTRSQLARLLMGEAILIGVCGILLSLLTGFCIGWTFTGWSRAWMSFGGLPVTLSIPWLLILQGSGFAFILCMIMAALPVTWLVRKSEITEALVSE